MKKSLSVVLAVVIVIAIVLIFSLLFSGITGKALWDWNHCTLRSPCPYGGGDCDKNSDCKTGLCNQDVGSNYGQDAKMDVCECPAGKTWNGMQCSSGFIGDVNHDGAVNTGDSLKIFHYIKSWDVFDSVQLSNADVNRDGYVSSNDAHAIQAYEVGLIGAFPYRFIVGDVNVDGKVNSGDALIISQFLNGLRNESWEYKVRGDINNDGVLDKSDSDIIRALEINMYGDVNGDNTLNQDDILLMLQASRSAGTLFSPVQLKLADYNRDGNFTDADISKLRDNIFRRS